MLYRYGQGDATLTEREIADAKAQLTDIAKAVPALAIFALPGGALLLPVMAKILPFDLFPSSFGKARRLNCNPVSPSRHTTGHTHAPAHPSTHTYAGARSPTHVIPVFSCSHHTAPRCRCHRIQPLR